MKAEQKVETPMENYAAHILRRYWRRHKQFKGFATHNTKKRK